MKWEHCTTCRAQWAKHHAHITGACASIGIEHDMDTEQVIHRYMTGFHNHHDDPVLTVEVSR
jgi:hypothetical protein